MFCPPSIPQTTKPLSNRELFGVLFLKYHGKGQLIHPSLVVNIIAGEVVQPIRRTAVFGKLQGAIMLGQGIGFLAGGMLGEWGGAISDTAGAAWDGAGELVSGAGTAISDTAGAVWDGAGSMVSGAGEAIGSLFSW